MNAAAWPQPRGDDLEYRAGGAWRAPSASRARAGCIKWRGSHHVCRLSPDSRERDNGRVRILALALALSLDNTFPYRDRILDLTFGVVVFSILLQGLTVKPLRGGNGEHHAVAAQLCWR